MAKESSYNVLIGPGVGGVAAIKFVPNPDFNPPLSLADAQSISSSFCRRCPFNPSNQSGISPFVSVCRTFNGSDLITTVTVPRSAARNDVIRRASCKPTSVNRL